MIIGYARVSTQEQDLARQIDALQNYGVEELYTEKMSGTNADRIELTKVKKRVQTGDSIVVESLSRLGRSTKDLLTLIDRWERDGVQLVSLKENIDTSTPTGKLLLTILTAICQFERDITAQRTKEGLKSAQARGRKGGRPRADTSTLEQAVKMYRSQTYSMPEICDITKISKATVYRALRNKEQNKKTKRK